jgi:hypothetical protein
MPLQIQVYLSLALEASYRYGERLVSVEIVEMTLGCSAQPRGHHHQGRNRYTSSNRL